MAATRSSNAGNTCASLPSSTLSSIAMTVTVCICDQFDGVNSSCGTTLMLPPVLRPVAAPGFATSVRPTSSCASRSWCSVMFALLIVMMRPSTDTSYRFELDRLSWFASAAAMSDSVSPNFVR